MVLENTLEHRVNQIQMAELQIDRKREIRRRFICVLHHFMVVLVAEQDPNEEIDPRKQYQVFVHNFFWSSLRLGRRG